MPTQYKPTPEQCADWIKDHQYILLLKTNSIEAWRCQKPGSSSYAFDLTMSRYGMAMYGDTGSLVFKVGASYGLEFLAKDDGDYVFNKLDQSNRETDLDEAYLLDIVYRAIVDLLAERDLELPEWLPSTMPMADRVLQLCEWLIDHQTSEFAALCVALREATDLEVKSTSAAYVWLCDHQELLELPDDMDYSLGKPTNAVMQRIYMLRHAAKQILAIKAATPATNPDVLDVLNHALVVETERAINQRDEFLRTGVVTAGHGGSHDTCFPAILRKHVAPLISEIERLSAPKQAPLEQLYAVHAQGPDELFAATCLEVAQKHARDLNVLHGGMVSAKVIDSPWSPAEHWKTLAEQNQHMIDDLRAQNGQNVVESARAIARYHVELMSARGYIMSVADWESDKAAVETVADIDKLLSSKWPHDGSHETGPVQYAYALMEDHPSDSWSNDGLASFVSDNELAAGAVIQRGEASKNDASYYLPDIDDVINHMANQASDDSEYADGFPDLTKAQEAELDTLMEPMRAWVDKHCDIRFYEVSKIEPYTVTEADVAAGQAYRAQLDCGAQA